MPMPRGVSNTYTINMVNLNSLNSSCHEVWLPSSWWHFTSGPFWHKPLRASVRWSGDDLVTRPHPRPGGATAQEHVRH